MNGSPYPPWLMYPPIQYPPTPQTTQMMSDPVKDAERWLEIVKKIKEAEPKKEAPKEWSIGMRFLKYYTILLVAFPIVGTLISYMYVTIFINFVKAVSQLVK
jgi:hypothetical protein